MVKRLKPLLLLTLMLPLPWVAASAQTTLSDKHYRLAAWSFYLQQPEQALERLQLAPEQDARTQLLEAGLYLQLGMPQRAAYLLQQLLTAGNEGASALPLALRNAALLQFARYQLETGNKAQAQQYLAQVNIGTDQQWLGERQLLNQLVNWPDIALPETPQFALLARHSEMPYIVSNQALVLAKSGQTELALHWLAQLQSQLAVPQQQGFWSLLFSGQWRLLGKPDGFVYPAQEQTALQDYLALLQAQLHIERQELAAADAILANFAADSVLSDTALQLYSHILTQQRHIPALLAVLQQQIKQQPFSLTAWQAASRIGEQLERAAQLHDALGAYHWAEQYYQQQTELINQQARPLQVSQLQHGLAPWQQLQLANDNNLYRLQQDILALQHQLANAPERQQRLARLTEVTAFKLVQQQDLLSTQLPQLTARAQTLTQQFSAVQQQIATAEQQPMALSLWQGEAYQQLSRLESAEQRFSRLPADAQQGADYAKRLARLRGLLHWQYSDTAAERRWQRQQQLTATDAKLAMLQQQLQTLSRQGNQSPRLTAVRQRLTLLNEQQQQLNLALLSQQQQLLARLNQQLQQLRQQQLASLTQLQRHNKEAMARVMERVLLLADSDSAKMAEGQ